MRAGPRETDRSAVVVIHGYAAPGFERVVDAFRSNFVERGELGASFAAVRGADVLVDIWAGLADRAARRPWDRRTLGVMFSASKGLVATCLLILIDRGLLDVRTPVSTYWPEFAAGNKRDVLVIEAVSHRAGVPGLTPRITVLDVIDDERMAKLVAAERKLTPASNLRYHALTFGWICGELVRRIDGRSVGHFFDDEIAQLLGLDAWIGLPEAHEARVATVEPGADWDSTIDLTEPLARSIYANPPRFVDGFLVANTREWHASEIPATSGIADARSLARLYACLADEGRIDETRRLLSAETIRLARTRLAEGHDPYSVNPLAFGIGFEVATGLDEFGPPTDAFGHKGAGGSCHGAWPSHRLGFSYLMNEIRDEVLGGDPRANALLASLYDAMRRNE